MSCAIQMVLLFLVVAAFAVVFSLVFSQIITKPISALTKGIQTMARGDFSTRVKVRGSGEMRRLARTFNSMSEKIESLDQARNQFVSNASHELKTPLATMKILIESLIYQPEMETGLRTEFLSDINREIDRLSSIVTDLLTLVRMDVKDVKLSRENMSLAELVKDTEHLLKPMAEKRHQTLVLSLQDECDMYADRTKLQQVVYNLMENAFKYTQDGGKVTVTLQKSGATRCSRSKTTAPVLPPSICRTSLIVSTAWIRRAAARRAAPAWDWHCASAGDAAWRRNPCGKRSRQGHDLHGGAAAAPGVKQDGKLHQVAEKQAWARKGNPGFCGWMPV